MIKKISRKEEIKFFSLRASFFNNLCLKKKLANPLLNTNKLLRKFYKQKKKQNISFFFI